MNLKKFLSLNFLGQLFLSAIFVNAIPGKITNFSSQIEFISRRGFSEPFSIFLLICSTILLISGVILLIFSDKTKLACSLLLIFLIPTTIIFHLVPFQAIAFSRNLSLIGGLFIAIDRAMVRSVNDNFVRSSKEV